MEIRGFGMKTESLVDKIMLMVRSAGISAKANPLPWITLDYLFQAKHFVLDAEAATRVYRLNRQRELLSELREFAIPPFPKMTFEMQTFHEKDGEWTISPSIFCIDRENGQDCIAWLYVDPLDNRGLWLQAANPIIMRQHEGMTLDPKSIFDARDLVDCFVLMLLAKRTTTVVDHAKRTSLHKGKRVTFYARSEITIALDPIRGLKRAVQDGSRGSPRRHGVLGHFTHRGGQKYGCTHDWEPVEKEDGKKRWECTHCGRKRTWRAAFERGDASKGYVRQSYKVKG